MKKFKVTGMSCASCSARVERAVGELEKVTSCSVNLLTNSMTVEGDASDGEIIAAVERAGYGASAEGRAQSNNSSGTHEKESNTEIRKILARLISSVVFLALLMYVSMGHIMWGAPLPSFWL